MEAARLRPSTRMNSATPLRTTIRRRRRTSSSFRASTFPPSPAHVGNTLRCVDSCRDCPLQRTGTGLSHRDQYRRRRQPNGRPHPRPSARRPPHSLAPRIKQGTGNKKLLDSETRTGRKDPSLIARFLSFTPFSLRSSRPKNKTGRQQSMLAPRLVFLVP